MINPFMNSKDLQSRFDEFKKGLKGNPKEMVEDMIRSGKMTQEQYNELSKQAEWLSKFLR